MAETLDRDLVKCRALGHWMDEDVEPINVRPILTNQLFARCMRGCGTHRIQSLATDDFTVIQSEYRYLNPAYEQYKRQFTRQTAKQWLLEHPVGQRGRRRRTG